MTWTARTLIESRRRQTDRESGRGRIAHRRAFRQCDRCRSRRDTCLSRSRRRGRAIAHQNCQTLLQCIDGPIRLILRNHKRRAQADRVLAAAENQKPALETRAAQAGRATQARALSSADRGRARSRSSDPSPRTSPTMGKRSRPIAQTIHDVRADARRIFDQFLFEQFDRRERGGDCERDCRRRLRRALPASSS